MRRRQKYGSDPTSNSLEQLAGGIVFVDGVASIVYSTDQRPLSNLGRLLRIGIGFGLVLDGSINK